MIIYTKSYEETINLGSIIGSKLNKGDVVLLSGDLGAGKTTLTKGIGKSLGVNKIINSPTFTIFKSYSGNIDLYHFDFYRLGNSAYDFILEEYLSNDCVTVIEWPSSFKEILPDEYLDIKIYRESDFERKILISCVGKKYEKILGELNELNIR